MRPARGAARIAFLLIYDLHPAPPACQHGETAPAGLVEKGLGQNLTLPGLKFLCKRQGWARRGPSPAGPCAPGELSAVPSPWGCRAGVLGQAAGGGGA